MQALFLKEKMMQFLHPHRTTWHITLGTYGTRLHHGSRPTVDKQHNRFGAPFLPRNPRIERFVHRSMNFPARFLNVEQQLFIEDLLPVLCDRGSWDYRISAAGPDHAHLLCDVDPEIHGERVRRLVKRWLTQALCQVWPVLPGQTWWSEEGSSKAVKEHSYLNNAYGYILRQRATQQAVAERGIAQL
jgi:REP element-mobilizing transposase RayT